MRCGRLILAASWLAAAPGWTPGWVPGWVAAWAQVTTNSGALDALSKPEPHRVVPRRAPPRRVSRPAQERKPAEATKPAPSHEAAPAPPAKLPTVPTIPPAILALPPPVVVPLAHPPPPPPIPVSNDAPDQATPLKDGVRITFGPDRADLNPATVQILRDFAHGPAGRPQVSINIYAYAAGSPEDPSTPRRLSLERALAARAVLMDAGIPSARIYPRALGPAGGDTLPDRIDVVAGAPTPAVQPPTTGGRPG